MPTKELILTSAVLILPFLMSVTNASLVAHFKFDGNVLDTSGNGYLAGDGQLYGNTHYVDGKSGQALAFDGSGDFIYVMVAPNGSGGWIPQVIPGSNAISITMWIKMDAYPTADTDFIAPRSWLPGDHSIEFHQYGFGYQTPFFIVSQAPGLPEYPHKLISSDKLGNWFHLAITYDASAGQAYMYIDGAAGEKAIITSGSLVKIGNYTIGGSAYLNSRYFNGQIDEVRIYDHALSPTEVQVLFNEFGEISEQCSNLEYLRGDLNFDCFIDLKDFAILANDWLKCTKPEDFRCQN
ncbi:MAG: hypothetical protein A2Y10_16900 [Planctomycetes bacterium GWF2_41_51]|nr:MAG: hypothetical protein A2Y10_16900 [Planctomycetes bacterium GWF2_41_51]HBG28091.1 hypothetical protein [Phycisphaerales bacterium]